MLSVVFTTWNEEKNLKRAVDSIKDIADEIIVVDTESTDGTVELAKKLKAKVFTHKNTSIVEPVRNFSIEKASGDWILLLDADEEVPETLAKKIKDTLANPEADYYEIPRKNIIFSKWISSSHWWPDYVYRLFKKGRITWKEAIHSVPQTLGKGEKFLSEEKYAIIHHNYSSVSEYLKRLDRYTTIQAEELQKKNIDFSYTDLLKKPAAEFISQYFARSGYKDGVHGLALSLLQAMSECVLYLKLWESKGFKMQEVSIPIVSTEIEQIHTDIRWWTFEKKIQTASGLKKILLKLQRKL